jgi:thioredoxin 1
MGKPVDVNDTEWDSEVLKSELPVLVDFWAPWCGPCKAVEPVLSDLAAAHEKVDFAKLNIDEHPLTASRYGVLAIPTAILFEGGEARETVVGARSRSQYEQAWGSWLRPSSATP